MTDITTAKPRQIVGKAFADFAQDGDRLVEAHRNLMLALEIAQSTGRSSPGNALAAVKQAIEREGCFPFRFNLASFEAARDAYHDTLPANVYDDQEALRASVSMHLAALLGSFPSSNIPDAAVYSRMLIEEVLADDVDLITVQAACSKIRRTQKFMPAIAEVIAAIDHERKIWRQRVSASKCIEETFDRLKVLEIELEREAKAHEAARQAALASQEISQQAFPVGALVYHPEHRKGAVEGYSGAHVIVGFVGSQKTGGRRLQVPASTLSRIYPLAMHPDIDQAVVHPWFGRGTVLSVESSTARIHFDDGPTRAVILSDEYLWTFEQLPPLAMDLAPARARETCEVTS